MQRRHPYNVGRLILLVALALAYGLCLPYLHLFTGRDVLDGAIGVFLGLFICAHPAANAVDVVFFRRYSAHELTSEWAGFGWLWLNLVVLLIGWWVITLGATRLVGPELL